jgi:tetratricopeptide (TPR) repeat protein
MFIGGRVLSDLGRPLSEPVSIELNCGMRSVQAIHTDLGGYFTFNLGSGAQSNVDFSASNESPQSLTMASTNFSARYSDPLTGCEIRVNVGGFRPVMISLASHSSDIGRVDLGDITLQRIGGAKGADVSVTSLLVPKEAAKEYERALKELQNNKPESALPHLEKAVSLYDKYAAAWNDLGRLYLSRNLVEKAGAAFEKSTAADADYIPPLIGLATIEIQDREWDKAVETAGKALSLDADVGYASFLAAVANYNLNRMDEAERDARQAANAPHSEDTPQVHALLGQIYMEKQDYPQAAAEMRLYLKQAPNGEFAEQIKKDLGDIEAWIGTGGADSSSVPAAAPGS